MLKKTLLAFVGAFILNSTLPIAAQDQTRKQDVLKEKESTSLEVAFEIFNRSKKIKDASVQALVNGGMAPYSYKWSNRNTPLTSSVTKGLTEGKEYSVLITDQTGNQITRTFTVEAKSLDERINATFVPLVGFMEKVLMADLFAMLNFYDPTITDENGEIMYYPNGDARQMTIPFVVVWLILGATYFTFRMKFINVRGFKHAINLVRGVFDNPKDDGEVSHFQALATALSATVGLGNIAGVAIAISIGGPGATFWMIIAGLLGMSSKFVECTLGVKYREIDENGQVSGGPMYYLSRGLKKRNLGGLGKVLAAIFAVLVIGGALGGGNMFQANQAFSQFSSLVPGVQPYGAYFGIILAILVGVVIIGGIKSIARVTEKIVPFMALLYFLTALIIILINISHAANAFMLILKGAFMAEAIKGGIVGVLVVGFQRAAFSNEAGVGSASIAHSAAKTKEPVSEGIVALLEPFIDTVVICTMTALVIIFTDYHENQGHLEGVELTSQAFGSIISWFPYLLVVAIFLFAFSTMISWSYYGLKGFTYLFGGWVKNKKMLANIFYVIFLIFIVIGSSSSLGAVVDFSDMMILSMAFPNILGLIIMSGEVRHDLKLYFSKVKQGIIQRYK